MFDRPNDYVVVRGLQNKVLNATILGSGVTLRTQRQGGHAGLPGWEYL
ncbi:hypothetical protein ACFPJ1_31635 [Kribbella qitaiheensis]